MVTLTEQGLKEALADLSRLRQLMASRIQAAEARCAEAEREVIETRRLAGFVTFVSDDFAARLAMAQSAAGTVVTASVMEPPSL